MTCRDFVEPHTLTSLSLMLHLLRRQRLVVTPRFTTAAAAADANVSAASREE